MSNWLSNLLKNGLPHKHWWRENGDGSYRVISSFTDPHNAVVNTEIATVTFEPSVPLASQYAAMAHIVKGLDN